MNPDRSPLGDAIVTGRQRAPHIREANCPTCHAIPGRPCVSSSGIVLAQLHRPRWRAAGLTPPPTYGATGGKNGRPLSPRGVKIRKVPCECGATIGKTCTNADGKPGAYHASRQIRAGVRTNG